MGPNVCSCNQTGIMNCHETKTLKCPYLDVFRRSASFLFDTKCGVMGADKKEGGGGELLLLLVMEEGQRIVMAHQNGCQG